MSNFRLDLINYYMLIFELDCFKGGIQISLRSIIGEINHQETIFLFGVVLNNFVN